MFAKFCKETGAEHFFTILQKSRWLSLEKFLLCIFKLRKDRYKYKWWKAQKCTSVSQLWFPHTISILRWCIRQDEHSLTPQCKEMIIILYYTFFMQLYYTQKESKQNQPVAQHYILFVVTSSTCFGQIYWPSSGSYMQWCSNLKFLKWLQMLLCVQS
jgi:hypothetical protein